MTYLLRLVACLFVVISSSSHAALYDRGNGLIYDDVLNITWLQDANYAHTSGYTVNNNGIMNWSAANIWAAQLEYNGYDDWRLASAGNSPTAGHYASGELSHMFYNNLGNTAGTHIFNGNVSFTDTTVSGGIESFLNVQGALYWLEEEYAYSPYGRAWAFRMGGGDQLWTLQYERYYAWAVADGDIGASPVPLPAGIYLFLSGLVGLGLMRGRRK